MKRWLILLALVFVFNFVSATVEVHNYSLDVAYSPFENITGNINWTIVDEDYDSLITSNDGDEIKLGDFLKKSGNPPTCSPPDCSKDYSTSSSSTDKSFNIPSYGKAYVGFNLVGEDINLTSLDFEIESDFDTGSTRPLSIEFFEQEDWGFSEFSNEFLSKNYGCYDENEGSASGAFIGPSLYCETISLPDTGKMKVGAKIGGTGVIGLNMTVYSGSGDESTCSYQPSTSVDGCEISPEIGDIFSAGSYYVCVSAKTVTNYTIYEESVGDKCGFVYSKRFDNSTKDYGIYAQPVKYADSDSLTSSVFDYGDLIGAANKLIGERYGGDCSSGCILPLALSGVSQTARIYDVNLGFTNKFGENEINHNIYSLDVVPVTLDFSSITDGLANLQSLGFSVSKSMNYVVSLSGVELFSELIEVLPSPIILSVLPLNPPAGVPVVFFAGIDYSENKSLSYIWDFGDGVTEKTNVPYIEHAYGDLKNYTLELTVSAGGNLTSTKEFAINTINPRDAINITLALKKQALELVATQIKDLPSWYSSALGKLIRMDFYNGEILRLGREFNNSFTPDDFVKVAKDLYALDVPSNLINEVSETSYFLTSKSDVDIKPIEEISGTINGATNAIYAVPILNWQIANIDVKYSSKIFSLSTYSQKISDVFSVYSYEVKSKSNEDSYFVINRPFSELYFKSSVSARKSGDSTVIVLPAGSTTSFEFYYNSAEPTTVFVSPRLASLVIEEFIDISCNNNYVCEEGESYETCRGDCKPIKQAILYIILALLFILIVYTLLQIWYMNRYENFLFRDKRQSYNLLMYVTNARARGMSDAKIAAELRKQGWSSERVNYIIRKSIGRRTGLIEIIPITKIAAYLRNKEARKTVATHPPQGRGVATRPKQQIGRNINKSKLPRRL